MSDLLELIPVTRLVPEGRHGRPDGAPGVAARLVEGLAAAILVARKGASGALAAALSATLGLALPDGPKAVSASGLTAIGTAPGRWLILAEGLTGDVLAERLQAAAGDLAAITDQSDAHLVFALSGPDVRAALAKSVTLDLDPAAFAPGDAATTSAAFVGLTLWQTDAAPTYRVAVARSYAPAFLRTLTASAAEYGLALSGTGRG